MPIRSPTSAFFQFFRIRQCFPAVRLFAARDQYVSFSLLVAKKLDDENFPADVYALQQVIKAGQLPALIKSQSLYASFIITNAKGVLDLLDRDRIAPLGARVIKVPGYLPCDPYFPTKEDTSKIDRVAEIIQNFISEDNVDHRKSAQGYPNQPGVN